MRQPFRQLRRVLAFLVLLAAALVAGVGGLLWGTFPGGDRIAAIPGLAAPVDITIDPDGIPRVRAANAADAAAAIGFLHARERLFQMELMRRAAAGELSEIIGSLTLPNDRLMRTLGLRARAEADLVGLPPETRAVLDAYARGVNAWIAARGRFAAPEFLVLGPPRPWTPTDSLLWGKTMGLYLSGNWRTELARAALLRRLPPQVVLGLWPVAGGAGHPEANLAPALTATAARLAAVLPSFPAPFTLPASASNAWAVDGARSATGAPLLAGDPHLGFGMPGVWYLARIDTPGRVLAGATAPGVPFLVLGHNGRIAWSFTTTGADVQDLFVETPAGDGAYLTPDGPHAFAVRQERILVRGAPDDILTVRETRHGPVVSDLVAPGGPILAVSMANLAAGDTAAAGLQALNDADDIDAAGQAAPRITSPVQNLLVADRRRIALFVTGRVPIRRAGDGALPAPGADGGHDWIGWAAGAELPHIVAPASGRLVNANERVAPADFPVFLGRDWFADWRARRIRDLLGASDRHTQASFASMQTDAVSTFARDALPRLRRVVPADAPSRTALSLLDVWDGTMAADRPQPLIFNAWMRRFRQAILSRLGVAEGAAAGLELAADALSNHAPGDEAGAAHCGGDCGPMLQQSLSAAMADLIAAGGDDPTAWRWGEQHQAAFAHPLLRTVPVLRRLAGRRIPTPGDDTTLFRGGMAAGAFTSVHGAEYRGVYDLSDLDRSLFVVTPGQSGNFMSPLAWNFMQRWRDGGTISLGPTPATVVAHIHLVPEGATP
ncbi:penicillin acylase family protein [Limobrevibacterium gyesilva]|uniref:Penicillin acylase family protein n=1 Tax=Limobrevibacterium gyesilva TaxID=2991712 RepID=A0AA41YP76_9PROT|nr:penicillin acylase family protein [Limobrevibacterium gyesilva]MCW3476171.1 penicillin acylase family protein [Limobrevibacterium gyesilva]